MIYVRIRISGVLILKWLMVRYNRLQLHTTDQVVMLLGIRSNSEEEELVNWIISLRWRSERGANNLSVNFMAEQQHEFKSKFKNEKKVFNDWDEWNVIIGISVKKKS